MLIVVIGNYMSTNLGDDMYLHLLRSQYPQHAFIPHSLLRARKPDFIIYGGGGILDQDSTRRVLLHEWVAKFRVPYAVLSVGSGVVDLKYEKRAFPRAKFITVRDEIALKAIPEAVLVPDLSWIFEPSNSSVVAGRTTGIMIRHSDTFDSFELVKRCRQKMEHMPHTSFLFFSTYGDRISDRTLCFPTAAGFNAEFKQYSGFNPDKYLEHYRWCERVITMPLHGIIFAAIYGIPWAAWIYSPKVTWLIEELKGEGCTDLNAPLVFNNTPMATVRRMRKAAQIHFNLLDAYLK